MSATVSQPRNPPVQLALRTRVCLMAATIFAAAEMSPQEAAETALDLEHAVNDVLEKTKEGSRTR